MKRLLKAVMLAFGAIFGLKGDTDAHWSEAPDQVQFVVEDATQDPAGGDPLL